MSLVSREAVTIKSGGETLAGELFLPVSNDRSPAIVVCHGAGEFKEHYFELCDYLGKKGVGSIAIDMHGHGKSGGPRYHVNIYDWIGDISAALDFLSKHNRVNAQQLGGFGLSSGGTAVLEAAVVDSRIKAVCVLDATVRNSLPFAMSAFLKILIFAGKVKRALTKEDLRINLLKLSGEMHLVSDPDINKRLLSNVEGTAPFRAYPFPGVAEAFFVDTIKRVSRITAPTRVIWGADDKIDPVETGKLLFQALTCKKSLEIVEGNGHMGHVDRNKEKVFALTADWLCANLGSSSEQVVPEQVACQAG
jgi:alpha-beta hydrolase superfamily lysophospholipase